MNTELKLLEEDSFIENNGGPKKLLSYFRDALSGIKTNTYQFDTDLLKDPYKEFTWLFTRIMGQDTIVQFPRHVIYVICFTFKMDFNFDWAHIISKEISHQLEIYQQTQKFFMAAYRFML